MTYGTVTVGWLSLRETEELDDVIHASTGARTVAIKGQESYPPLTLTEVRQRAEDIVGLRGELVPIRWTDKNGHDGYYLVDDVNTSHTYHRTSLVTVDWTLRATYIGPSTSTDLESRLQHAVRPNGLGVTGERWHAPPIGHYGYTTGTTTVPSTVTRTGADGAMTVYRGVPAVAHPRWTCAPSDYLRGACRISVDGTARSGTDNVSLAGSGWLMDNGLVRVSPVVGGTLRVSGHDGTAWRDQTWNITTSATGGSGAITTLDGAGVRSNRPEKATIRILVSNSPGRTLVDVTIRRGSRLAEIRVQRHTSSTIGIYAAVPAVYTSVPSGGYTWSATDANGNRSTVGSMGSVSYNSSGGLYDTSVTSLTFYVALVVGGASAVSGDTVTALRDQYVASHVETTMGVKR